MINRERGDVAKKTNVAVIGLGWPGREHLKGYLANDKAKVVAVCDMNTDLAKQLAAEHGIEAYGDHRKMLKEAGVDAVSVCLPNFLHAPVSLDVLKAGKHVICEKPVMLYHQSRGGRKNIKPFFPISANISSTYVALCARTHM